MIQEIIKDHNMDDDLETDWMPVFIDEISNFGKKARAESLELYWKDVTGVLDGEIQIFISNGQGGKALGNTYFIEEPSNIEDCEFIVLDHINFKYLKIKYIKNNITGGTLNAVIGFGEYK